jgi:hypothetical protein
MPAILQWLCGARSRIQRVRVPKSRLAVGATRLLSDAPTSRNRLPLLAAIQPIHLTHLAR